MKKRIAAALLGALHILNGGAMLLDGERWFMAAAASTGPFNSHFVADVGAAFVAAGLGLVVRSWRIRYWPAAVAGSAFLVFHALIHIVEFAAHPHDLRALTFIVVTAALALWAAFPSRGEQHAERTRPQGHSAHGGAL